MHLPSLPPQGSRGVTQGHRRTKGERDVTPYDWAQEPRDVPDSAHGHNGYVYWKCRCDTCREGHRQQARLTRRKQAGRLFKLTEVGR